MRIAAAMSGGVDSSVAALLLKRDGADVVGLSMHLWDHDRDGTGAGSGRCCTADDLTVARRAADAIGVPHYVLDLTERFEEAVVRPFVTSYLEGRTPIPCTACNTEVKFKTLLARAEALGCDAVATGHYARIEKDAGTGNPRLLKARDLARDQSYFLWDLTEEQLSRILFPLGDLTKPEVREIARAAGLPNWDKPDSQEICFVPQGTTPADFIRREAPRLGLDLPAIGGAQAGEICLEGGERIGEHRGTMAYTVGQRKGIGVAAKEPLYVLATQPEEARVLVGPAASLLSKKILLHGVSVRIPRRETEPAEGGVPVLARIRSRHPEQAARLTLSGDGRGWLEFEVPVRAAAPGQSAVFYDAARPEVVLGGGVIARDALLSA
jgi:tRNA-specific 2-thiouridylase